MRSTCILLSLGSICAFTSPILKHYSVRKTGGLIAKADPFSASDIVSATASAAEKVPSDPHVVIKAGSSIPPNLEALGVEVAKNTEGWPDAIKEAAEHHGINVVDATQIAHHDVLPGFSAVKGILQPASGISMIPETPESFAMGIMDEQKLISVIHVLPTVALLYALVEFFILRPNIDTLREGIMDRPEKAFAETLAVTGVRFCILVVIALLATAIFGR